MEVGHGMGDGMNGSAEETGRADGTLAAAGPTRRSVIGGTLGLSLAAGFGLAGCTTPDPATAKLPPLGDFRLGYVVVVTDKVQKGPLSRDADPKKIEAALKRAIRARLGRYEGERLYHIAVNVGAYVLAQPGIPLVLSPKSALVLLVTIWDDAKKKKLNEKPHQITIIEEPGAGFLVGSGYTQTADQQLESLARQAAKAINDWLYENRHWFEGEGAKPHPKPKAETGR